MARLFGSRAAGTKDVVPYTIVGGVPAKVIRKRYDEETIQKLERIRWWDWEEDLIRQSIHDIQNGDTGALEKRGQFL